MMPQKGKARVQEAAGSTRLGCRDLRLRFVPLDGGEILAVSCALFPGMGA